MRLTPGLAALLLFVGAPALGYYLVKGRDTQPTSATSQRAPGGFPGGGSGGGGKRGFQTEGPAPVALGRVTKQSVPVYREGIGNVQSLAAVTVRAQIDGRLLSVHFMEGQDVKKGDVLARIDPATYKALYDQAVAKKAQDAANLANGRIDLERYRRLAQTSAGPKQQADQQAAQVAQLEAQLKSDQAAIDNAKAVLDYTTIVSPLDGRVGLRQVDAGNIVRASDAGGIVSITQVMPIGVLFTLPQRDLGTTVAALSRGPVAIDIPASDGASLLARGTLQSIDNQIDVTTGTVKLKATFPNTDRKLWPGQFVSVRVVVETLTDAKVVPASAIRRGISGNFVYIVGDDRKAVVKPVTVTLQNENIAVIADGVDFDQQVVTEGFARLTDGKVVVVAGAGNGEGKDGNSAPRGDIKQGDAKPGDGKRGKGGDGTWGGKGKRDAANPEQSGAQSGGPTGGEKRERRKRDADQGAPDGSGPGAAGQGAAGQGAAGQAPAGQGATNKGLQ